MADAQEFIQNAFIPQIAVLCSSSVDQVCKKNNLSFVELVQPFCKLNVDVNIQDVNGESITIRNLKVKLSDVNSRPPQPTLARKLLSAAVSVAPETKLLNLEIGEYSVAIPTSTPWFQSWRDMFLQGQLPSDHEFTKHYLACILVVSTADANPVEAMTRLDQTLNKMQNLAPNKLPKWFCSTILRYYVLLHDNSDADMTRTNQAVYALNLSYGIGKVFLLGINSKQPTQFEEQSPDPWHQYISTTSKFESIGPNQSSPDDSSSITQTKNEGIEAIECEVNLPYHPLSPETEVQKLPEELLVKESPSDSSSNQPFHGICLTTNDIEQIKLLIYEFCTRALLPYIERQLQNLTEIVSNKKGVSKSLLSATKRWFTPNKAGSGGGNLNMPVYAPDAPELQMRKLGDLYFMFGHYKNAFQIYHAAKRDFNADQAWLYYAGALEMAALAAFMANLSHRKTYDYMDESINTYLNVCKLPQFATRSAILSSECLKSRKLYGEAANQLIRMTSEESDLRSALLLEQAAYCFLNNVGFSMIHKYGFHMVLAGHRFSKASQKKHALRCYTQALNLYNEKKWCFAEDHIYYTIGKLSVALNQLPQAAKAFSKLLTNKHSKQAVEQQCLFLKEYLSTQRTIFESKGNRGHLQLSIPLLVSKEIKILVGPTPPLSIPGKVRAAGMSFSTAFDSVETKQKWSKLEEMLVQEAQGSMPLVFKPAITLYTKDNINNVNLIAIVKEPIQVCLELHNVLLIEINLNDVYLLWKFRSRDGDVISNEDPNYDTDKFFKTSIIKNLSLPGKALQEIVLCITPLLLGELFIEGIYYNVVHMDQSDEIRCVGGKQLFDLTKLGSIKKTISEDPSINQVTGLPITIMPPAPSLQVTFEEIENDMLANEIKSVTIEMRNVGSVSIHKVLLATSMPHFLSSCEFYEPAKITTEVNDLEVPAVRDRIARKIHVMEVPLPNRCLEPSQSHSVNVWIKAPNVKGPVSVDLLIYYENSNNDSKAPKYRLIRHMWALKIHDSLQIDLNITESCKSEDVKELLFEVKATNTHKAYSNMIVDITILKAVLLSSNWKLKPLNKPRDYKSLVIYAEQSAYFLLRSERCVSERDECYEITFINKASANRNAPYMDFAKRTKQIMINIFDNTPIIKNKQIDEGHLFFQWMATVKDNFKSEEIVNGQTAVLISKSKNEVADNNEQTHPLEIPTAEKEIDVFKLLRSQISMGITNKPCMDHNFDKDAICITLVKIAIHNDSNFESLITINTIGTSSQSLTTSKPNLFCPYPSKDYRWVGFTGTVMTIPPLCSKVIMLNMAVSAPGVYDLSGRLEVWCKNELCVDAVLQDFHPTGFLTVRNIT